MTFTEFFTVLHGDADLLQVFNCHVEDALIASIVKILGEFYRETGSSFHFAALRFYSGQPWVYSKGIGLEVEEFYAKNCPHRSPQAVMDHLQPDTSDTCATAEAIRRLQSVKEPKILTGVNLQRSEIRTALVELVKVCVPTAGSRTSVTARLLIDLNAVLIGFERSKPGKHWANVETYDKQECCTFLEAYQKGDLKLTLNVSQ